ncbi:uncharacterized protein LOC108160063 isoform X1 [Drosophila miranda]|uniref:uncharacterized protein LOC108160063 isoform X1 n=1 Tax=Drosophila miranda TaxID=7229 RepID=UPI0007E62F54|nr:uncharacterized protein LOC108160063 isoform X1 [Drosophila miranda]XP_033247835.1 uncharacterized protein LOC108160063 isoform X1 [Drosophila miranda]
MWNANQLPTQPRQFYLGLLLITICAVLSEDVCAVPTDQSYVENTHGQDGGGMQALQKRPAFFVGSRYGRSSGNTVTGGGATSVGSSKTRRLIIVPRNDRFFLGSRYGKRNGEYLSPYEQNSLSLALSKDSSQDVEQQTSNTNSRLRPSLMSCVYTGISNYYRCKGSDHHSAVDEILDSTSMAESDGDTNNVIN